MASLRQNGQKYKCPFFKSARENLQTPLWKTRCEHYAANCVFSLKIMTA